MNQQKHVPIVGLVQLTTRQADGVSRRAAVADAIETLESALKILKEQING